MADVATALKGSDGVAFLVSAGIVYEIIAAACSSPQTTEINAGRRADTLMKWVNIGVGQAVLFVLIAAWLDRAHRWSILGGGALAAVLMYGQYAHARAAGLRSTEPGTETY
ncbi:MAG TPA: hypothetical protein VFB06_34410 [Streptosporangiaceae bacterium]|nr:hypothetical protein [Streptosporangiaceae bacterium]